MRFIQHSFYTILFFTFNLFVCNVIFAQSEDTTKLSVQSIDNQYKLSPFIPFDEFQPIIFSLQNSIPSRFSSSKLNQFKFSIPENPLFNKLSLRQSKSANSFSNLGAYEHFNNSFKYNASSKLTMYFDFGLLEQNTVLTANQPNYQFTFGTSIEYNINHWLSLYGYGQYLVPTTNQANFFVDPLTSMSPIFFQSEIGGGARGKYKNIKADVGLTKIYDTQFNQSNPVNSMNTKISIGF